MLLQAATAYSGGGIRHVEPTGRWIYLQVYKEEYGKQTVASSSSCRGHGGGCGGGGDGDGFFFSLSCL